MISVHFQGKPFVQHHIIQIYAPTANAKEAEVDKFYENLEDLLELTPKKKKKDILFIIDNWNVKVGSQETTWSNRQVWLWSTKWSRVKANWILPRECIGHSKYCFQKHKRWFYIWTSPNSQYGNQIDYIICSWKWRSCIQKQDLGADCGSGFQPLIEKTRLKLKKAGKTTRPERYDLTNPPLICNGGNE